MSRTGKMPIAIPDGVEATLDKAVVRAKGKQGELSYAFGGDADVTLKDGLITVVGKGESRHARAMWGTVRARIANIVQGVNEGFSRALDVNGVGYRAEIKGGALEMQLGYSHSVVFPIPEGVKISCPKPTQIVVTGVDKQRVGQVAADIRAFRKPEPYKGKGIRYADEHIVRKEGKKK